ncbi:unnamed protein product [Paramecium sonneborni]|uniref:Uncharacterized protein n=1 Tax=Paramecium sonneborni TaxID=65129 RepID=A0A8S1L5F5_9CILI|nr:unnamed protein product [Paramecium sonneborni]
MINDSKIDTQILQKSTFLRSRDLVEGLYTGRFIQKASLKAENRSESC